MSQNMTEEQLRRYEQRGTTDPHSTTIVLILTAEIRRLQQRERDLQTAVQLNEGLSKDRALYVYNDATLCWDRARAEDLQNSNAQFATVFLNPEPRI
jgi:hypothetical protein